MHTALPATVSAAIEVEVDKLLRETETSTYSLGGNLRKITEVAEQFITEIQRKVGDLGTDGEASVTGALEEQTRTVGRFVTNLSETVRTQQGIVEKIGETSDIVSSAAASVAAISLQSRMLSLNTMIEANRLGTLGLPFMVIAKEMRDLSESIAASNERISALTRNLLPMMTMIRKSLEGLGEHAHTFGQAFESQRVRIDQVTNELQAMIGAIQALGDERLATIVERSNASLVDLQMQDILAQRLRRILALATGQAGDSSLALSARARHGGATAGELMARGEATSGYLSEELSPAEGGLASGEMELF